MSNDPTSPTDQHRAEVSEAVEGQTAQEQRRPPKRQRCQQCQALVMPAALNDLLRCLSCTGQLDLFRLTEANIVERGQR